MRQGPMNREIAGEPRFSLDSREKVRYFSTKTAH